MVRFVVVALAVVLASAAIAPADAACVSKKCPEEALVEQARQKAQETCGCTRPGQSHGKYVKCVKKLVKAADLTALLPQKACRKLVTQCESNSICGKPNAVVCCETKKNGKIKASIKPSAAKCNKGDACGASGGFYSTSDACAADGTCATTTPRRPRRLRPPARPSLAVSARCPNNPTAAGSPKQLCLLVPLVDPATGSNGSDLDTGYSGALAQLPGPRGGDAQVLPEQL